MGVFLKQILRNKDDSPFILSLLPHILLPEFSLTYSQHFQTSVYVAITVITLTSYNFTWKKEEKKGTEKVKEKEREALEVEKEIVFRSPRGGKLSSLMHFPFVREYQSDILRGTRTGSR